MTDPTPLPKPSRRATTFLAGLGLVALIPLTVLSLHWRNRALHSPACPPAAPALSCPEPEAIVNDPSPPASCDCPSEKSAPAEVLSANLANTPPEICPDGMALVQGQYCPLVEQRCLEYAKNKAGIENETVCMKFEKPSICLSPSRAPMRYCMDRYEYPGTKGEMPQVLTSWEDASKLCRQQGKRLCSESEFNFACEGEEMLPYSYGYDRDSQKCNVDKPYLGTPAFTLSSYPNCMRDKNCLAEFERLDQREQIGTRTECSSPFGIFDLNGNVNEFAVLKYKTPPHRAALKGGWWGPVRGRCRPIVMHHDEKYLGYEVGFRCCRKPLDDEAKEKAKAEARRARILKNRR